MGPRAWVSQAIVAKVANAVPEASGMMQSILAKPVQLFPSRARRLPCLHLEPGDSPAATPLPPSLTMSMSVLRSCQRALPARATGISLASVRSLATDSATPAAKPTEQKQIEHAPQQDILAADLVSGAPSV